ncbi:transglycosylase domain-containing protein [Kitasatospora sp. CMC57]|uniref:Transglycosylase domain-containing protein n=1 Tax=Kitasatospora sp. CMC57 TaxID=3231513 RepID=A0AB33K1X1_9ACTN
MSEHRRRSSTPDGEDPSGHQADDGRPYAYGSPPEGAPSYAAGGGRPSGGRPTGQQPRLTRAEMRRQQANRSGGGNARRGAAAPGAPPVGRNGKPAKKRFIDYPRFGKTGFRRWIPSWKLQLSVFLLFFGAGVGAVGIAYAMTPIPDVNKVVESQNNIYYWADGSEMTRQGDTNRQVVQLGDISKDLQDAAISTENASFWDDSGIDPKGIARAVYNMATGGETQGGSTITQQYVKNAYLSQDQTLSRKVRELFITLKVNQEEGKPAILTGYLNTSWFGRGATGAQAAAQAYYGVNAKDLNLCQSALLAGLLKGAALYDPATSPANHERAVKRWNEVLDRMVTTGAITKEKRAGCATFPEPITKKPPASMNGQVSYMVELANKYVMSKDKTITEAALAKGGYQIHTTFQKDKVDALKKAVDDFQADTLKPDKRKEDTFVQIGAASVLPNDGAIVAIYGGPGVELGHHTNNADTLGIPVGSTFKPFVLAAAMQYGVQTETGNDGKPKRINADSRYLADDKSEIHKPDGSPVIGDDGKPYHQKNSGKAMPGYVSLREAMRNSYNVPFVQLGQDVGTKVVGTLAEQMGLRHDSLADSSTTTFPLGTSTPSAIRMASAYSVFAARGQQTDPYSVSKVVREGVELKAFAKPTPKPVLEEAVADNVTDVLTTVAKSGTGEKTNALGRPIAGKTGTTDKGLSAWWVGYTPSLVTSVGMWREEPGKPGLISLDGTAGKDEVHGGDFPTDVFVRYMKIIMNGQPKEPFPKPAEIGEQVDSSGAPATASASASATATTPVPDPTTIAPPTPTLSPSAPATPTATPSATESCLIPAFCPSGSPSPTRTKPTKPSGSASASPSPDPAANTTP